MAPNFTTVPSGRGLGRRVSEIVESAGTIDIEDLPRALIRPGVIPLDALPIAMLVVTSGGEALAANDNWSELTGLSRSASLGRGWLDALRDRDREVLTSYLDGTVDDDQVRVVDTALGCRAGAWTRWWLQPYERAGERLIALGAAEVVDERAFWDVVLQELPPVLSRLDAIFDDLGHVLLGEAVLT